MTQDSGPDGVVKATGDLPRRVLLTRTVRLVALLVVIALAVVAVVGTVARSGPPTRQDLLDRAGLVGKQQLLIGVKDDQPGVALVAPDGSYSGFDIDAAKMIAADLGFLPGAVRFLPIESEDRARMQARDGGRFVTVDLVIASYSITEQRQKLGVNFSAPYLSTEQSVVTRKTDNRQIDSLRDLRGRKVCTLATSTSEANLRDLGADVISKKKSASACRTCTTASSTR